MVGMTKEALAEYFPNVFNWPPEQYDKFLDTFARFNRDVADTDSPDDTWILVKFLKKHTIPVDSDTAQSLLEGEARYFDSSGRAVEARLRRGEDGTVTFEIGDTGCFDLDSATALIDDGICEKIKPVYRRQLHDYARFFRETYYRHRELDESILRQKRDTDILVNLKTNVEAQAAAKQMDKDKLASDLVGFKTELSQVTSYTQMLDAEWEKSRVRLSELYRRNLELSAELTQVQAQLADEINRRTAAATARTPPAATAPPATATPPAPSFCHSPAPPRNATRTGNALRGCQRIIFRFGCRTDCQSVLQELGTLILDSSQPRRGNRATMPVATVANLLERLFAAGEDAVADFFAVLADGLGDHPVQVGVLLDEPGLWGGSDSQQVVDHQDLAVAGRAGADADGGDAERLA